MVLLSIRMAEGKLTPKHLFRQLEPSLFVNGHTTSLLASDTEKELVSEVRGGMVCMCASYVVVVVVVVDVGVVSVSELKGFGKKGGGVEVRRRFQRESGKSISSVGSRHSQIEQQKSVLAMYTCSWNQNVHVYTEITVYTGRYMARTREEGV